MNGTLNGQLTPRFLPKQIRTFWRLNPGVKTRVYACLTCGAVTMAIDPDELRRLLAR